MDETEKETFAIQIMCKLSQLPNDTTKWTEESTTDLCELCDMISDDTVANCLIKYNLISIVQTIMETEHIHYEIPRLTELLVCLLNNLCCYGDIHANLVSSDDVTLAILALFSKSDDTEFLKETFRYIFTVTSGVPRERFLNDSWCSESSDAPEMPNNLVSQDDLNESGGSSEHVSRPPVAQVASIFESILGKFMTGQDAQLKLIFILRSSTNTELLEKALEFLTYICIIPDQDEKLFSHYLPAIEVVESVIEALKQIEANESLLSISIPRYFASILASFVHDEGGRESLMIFQPPITLALCRLLTYYYAVIMEDVIKIYTSYMIDGILVIPDILTKLLWVYDEVTNPKDEGKSWEHWTRHEGEDVYTHTDSTVAFWIEDYLLAVLSWTRKQKRIFLTTEIYAALTSIRSIITEPDSS